MSRRRLRASASVGSTSRIFSRLGTAFWCLPSLSAHSAAIRRCSAGPIRRIRGRLGLASQDVNQIAPPRLRLVPGRQRRQRLGMLRINLKDVQVRVDDHDVQVQPVAVDLGDFQVASDALLVRLLGQRLDVVFQQIQKRVPLLGADVEPVQGLDRFRQVGLEPQQPLPDVDDLLGILGAGFRRLRHLDAERDPALRIRFGLLRPRQNRQQLWQIVAMAVKLAVELDHRAVGRIEFAQLSEKNLGLRDLVQLLPQNRRELHQQRHVGLATLGTRRQIQDLGQFGPVLLLGQRGDDRAQGFCLARGRLQRLAEVRQRFVGLAQFLRQLRHRHFGERAVLSALRL